MDTKFIAAMDTKFIAAMATIVIGLVAGGFYVGHLQGRIDELGTAAVVEARNDAISALRQNANDDGWSAPAYSTKDMSLWVNPNGDTHIVALGLGIHEGICWLSRVQGKFEGVDEHLRVIQHDGRWILAGSSKQPGVHTAAYCWRFPWVPQADARQAQQPE